MKTSAAALVLLCASFVQGHVFAESVSDIELVQIAAMREELSRFNPGKYTAPRAFCVGVRAHVGDPSSMFLSALSNSYKHLIPLGKCNVECPDQNKASLEYPRPPLFTCGYITAGDVWFEPDGQANLSIAFTAGPLWGRTGVYKLRKAGDQWQVVGYELHTIS